MRPSLPPIAGLFNRASVPPPRASVRERAASPVRASQPSAPPRAVVSTSVTDPWLYDWLSTGDEW
jgi:hypothetical protein